MVAATANWVASQRTQFRWNGVRWYRMGWDEYERPLRWAVKDSARGAACKRWICY